MEVNREQIVQALEFCSNCECNSEKTNTECALINMPFCKNYLRQQSLALIKELAEEKSNLEYILMGVMHSVDKWLDGAELEMDEVNRAITMREKTLQIVESITGKWEEAINQVNYIADVTKAETARKIQEKVLSLSTYGTINISPWQLEQVIKEILED